MILNSIYNDLTSQNEELWCDIIRILNKRFMILLYNITITHNNTDIVQMLACVRDQFSSWSVIANLNVVSWWCSG